MHHALLLVAAATRVPTTSGCCGWDGAVPWLARVAVLEERVARLETESTLLRNRFHRIPGRRRPHYRRHERLDILWHAARYGLSDFVSEFVHRLKAEWPHWGTRRIAGQLARLGVKASRSSVQRILRRGPRPPGEPVCTDTRGRVLLAKRPDHIWMIDFTRIGGLIRPLWVGAVIDAFSRQVLAIGAVRGAPSSRFAVRLLREAIRRKGPPRWLVTDKDPILRGGLVQRLLTAHGILRRYGAVGRRGSMALIERTWRSLKTEYVRHLFLHRPIRALEGRLRSCRRWFNAHRPHQGLGRRTPDDVYRGRRPRRAQNVTAGVLHVRFLDGDHRLPVLRLRRAA